MYHSPRPLYRVNAKPGQDGEVEAAVEELLGKGLVHDVVGIKQHQGEAVVLMVRFHEPLSDRSIDQCVTTVLRHPLLTLTCNPYPHHPVQHTYEILASLRADELARLNDTILGPARARGNSGGSGGGGGWSRTRDDSLGALEGFIEQCVASPHPQQHALLRRRLGKDLVKFLGTCSAGGGSGGRNGNGGGGGGSSSRFLLVAPAVGKLLHRVYALFFVASGYEPDDAVILLRHDIRGLRFMGMMGQGASEVVDGGASTAAAPPAPITRITAPFRPLFRHMLALVDTFEDAVLKGDGAVAYACLHQAADFFLPPTAAAAAASTADGAAAEAEAEAGEPRWEPAIVVVGDDDDDDGDDDVIVIEPGPTAAAPSLLPLNGAAGATSFSSSSSSLSAPVAMPHRSSPPFPPRYKGLQDMPKPLLQMAAKIMGRYV